MSRDDADSSAVAPNEPTAAAPARRRGGWAVLAVFLVGLAVTGPTAGDAGLTWDEPAYRFSQLRSERWWARLVAARSGGELRALVEPDALLFYWTYARHGINFHPPLAGQLNALAHVVTGPWLNDTASRRMASVAEFALTVALIYGFLARRYGPGVALVAAGALLTMPRLQGDAHVAGTDMPGLLLWVGAALTAWKGLNDPNGRRWRVLVGVLVGLAFVEKMGTVFVVAPILGWLALARLPALLRRGTRADWIDGLTTLGALVVPLAVALVEILRLARLLPRPIHTNLFYDRPPSYLPGAFLLVPLGIWLVRRGLGWLLPRSPVWGVERPGLELIASILAFGSAMAWLGNPAWWRDAFPRLAHYYLINTDRRGSLPDIQIYYLGQTYEYSLPWANGWVLLAVTVPALTLVAAALGLVVAGVRVRNDRLPLYVLLHLATLPVFRMFPTPAHDGVRLFLPTFAFLAMFAGWGTIGLGRAVSTLLRLRPTRSWLPPAALGAAVVGASALALWGIHPYELSYYNAFVGGPRGAWRSGFEMTYWYDAFTPAVLRELNGPGGLPKGATVDFMNEKTEPMVFLDQQSLGRLRPDIRLGLRNLDAFPYVWLLAQDSKASAFTRVLYALTPWYASTPAQLDGLRPASVAAPDAVARAWALALLCDAPDPSPPEPPRAPGWVRASAPWLGRLWGDGLIRTPRPSVYEPIFRWARSDPAGLRAAAKTWADARGTLTDPAALRLKAIVDRYARAEPPTRYAWHMLNQRPGPIAEAVDILIARPEAVREVLTRYGYTAPSDIGGYLDAGMVHSP